MRMWLLGGLVAVGSAGIVACGGMETDDDLGTQVAAHKNQNECTLGDEERICRHVDGDKNITHVFLDVPECFDPSAITRVIAFDDEGDVIREYPASRLHDNGGPCQSEVERDLWFPLQENQDYARICVYFEADESEKMPDDIGIGWKYGGTCEEDNFRDDCILCDEEENNHVNKYRGNGAVDGSALPQQIDGLGDQPTLKSPTTPVFQ